MSSLVDKFKSRVYVKGLSLKKLPVCTFIGVSLIIIFLLYNTKVLNSIPCGGSFKEIFCSNFCHIDPLHLITNLFYLYVLSTIEQEMGAKSFIWLIVLLLLLNTLIEYFARIIFKYSKCSIGFSGILFGMMAWQLLTKNEFDPLIIIAIGISIISSSKYKDVSLFGHVLGAITGIIGALIWSKLVH